MRRSRCAGWSDWCCRSAARCATSRIASFTISLLTIFPPLLVMTVVNKVLQFNSVSTLVLMSA